MIQAERRGQLAALREQLVLRAAGERRQLAQAAAPLAPTWHRIERGLLLWREARRRPWLLAIPAAVLLWWRPRGSLTALTALPSLWRAGRSARQIQRHWRH